jgi:hypothetical protein
MNNLTPSEFYLGQNYPNPFKERTTIKFCVAYKTKVKLKVCDSEGNMMKILIDEEKEAGTYEVEFNESISHSSEGLPNGKTGGNLEKVIYFYRLEAGNYKSEKKMILAK